MDIKEIIERYNKGDYTVNIDNMRILPKSHVFDENLSVKQNQDMVVEHNERAYKQRNENVEKQAELTNQLRVDVINYVCETYNVCLKQAQLIEQFAYSKKQHSQILYLEFIDDVAKLVEAAAS